MNLIKERPSISVCMATYNGERYLEQQIESIIPQLRTGDELVIVDDASTDRTIEIVKYFECPHIRLLENTSNQGVIKSFEKAISSATGEIIFLCDQDDVWHPNKVQSVLLALKQERCIGVVSDCQIINEKNKVLHNSYFEFRGSGPGLTKNFLKNGYLGCAMCFRSSLKDCLLPFPKHISMHDEWIGLVGDCIDRIAFLNQPLFDYRRHSLNVTSLKSRGISFALKKRILNLFALLFRFKSILRNRKKIQAIKREFRLFI